MSKLFTFLYIIMAYSLNAFFGGLFLLLISCVSISTTQNKDLSKQNIFSLSHQLEFLDDQSIEQYLQNFSQQHKDDSSQWWVKYQMAHLWKKEHKAKSCATLKELAHIKAFPLNQVAFIQTKTVCPIEEKDLTELKEILQNKSYKWLHRLTAQVGAEQAEKLALWGHLAYFQYKLSYYTPIPSHQIELLEQSIAHAQKADDLQYEKLSTQRLYQIAPRLISHKKVSPFKLAYDYRKARQFDKAIAIYRSTMKDPQSSLYEVYQSIKHLRTISKLMNNKKDVLKYSAQLERVTRYTFWRAINAHPSKQKFCPQQKTKLYHDGALIYAKTLWTQNQISQAQEILQNAHKNLINCQTSGEIYWVLAQMKEESGNFTEAIVWTQKGIEMASNKSFILEKLKWRLAWNLRKTSQFEKAITAFKDIINTTQDNFLLSKYTYWMARTYEDIKASDQAGKLFQKLIQTSQMGYYGLLAHRSLKKPLSALNNQSKEFLSSKANHEASQSQVVDEDLIKWLIAVNEKELAKNYLKMQKRKITRIDEMENFIDYFSIVGDHIEVFSYVAQSSSDTRNYILSNFPHLLFPTPYLNQITKVSNKYNVPKEFIYSIIRQESAFNRYARSPADAFGLMQILPRVAKRSAQQSKTSYQSIDDLFNPEINLSLGTFYLRQLLDKFDNQFIMAIASYNAPEEAVRHWVKKRYRNEPVEFIEDIPYKETRLYVKLVIRNLVFYQRLFSENEILFPEWCLNGLQIFKS